MADKWDFSQEGEKTELYISKVFHGEGVPFLISPMLLRRRGLGQIDVCYWRKNKIIAAECKLGEGFITSQQKDRLKHSIHFLGNIFNCSVELKLVYGFAKSFESAYSFNSKKIGELT